MTNAIRHAYTLADALQDHLHRATQLRDLSNAAGTAVAKITDKNTVIRY